MCGIIGGVGERSIAPLLIEGLTRLEYRGYDSAGLALLDPELRRLRVCGKVQGLKEAYEKTPLLGKIGIAHTRWATHGVPNEENAHPHFFEEHIALVHNGIIENDWDLRQVLQKEGVTLASETDSEVIVQWIGRAARHTTSFLSAVQATLSELQGAYALALITKTLPDRIIVARQGSPLVIGIGIGEHFVASDSLALLPFTREFVTLEEGDVAEVFRDRYVIYDRLGNRIERKTRRLQLSVQSMERGHYRHFMQKEIFEQPEAVSATLSGRGHKDDVSDGIFGAQASAVFDKVQAVQIVACGTSFHAGLVAKYWLEHYAGIMCSVEEASEFRYRKVAVREGTLFVALSQSGETADTLAAARCLESTRYCGKLTICNVPESALVRESDLVFLTHAGPEIGVASTKAFVTQLVALLLLTHCLGKRHAPNEVKEASLVSWVRQLPSALERVLQLDSVVNELAHRFDEKHNALFVARGVLFPIVKEGALKLKEISYIHAQAHCAGELKHGPLALVDKQMPVIALAANDHVLDKLLSNFREILARQGELIVFAEKGIQMERHTGMHVIEMPEVPPVLAPFAFTVLLQLLAYHVAVLRGTDVDRPRNLAKSVTVE